MLPSFNLGYKRKEVAYVRILEDKIAIPPRVYIPSLLAGAELSSHLVFGESNNVYNQVFATGNAASFMAMHPEIRKIIGLKFAPINDEEKKKVERAWTSEEEVMARKINEMIDEIEALTPAQALTAENGLTSPTGEVLTKMNAKGIDVTRLSDGDAAKKALRIRAIYGDSKELNKVETAVSAAAKS